MLRDPGREKIAGIGLKEETTETTSTKMSEHLQTMWDGSTLEGASGSSQNNFGKVVILSTCQAVNKKAEMGEGGSGKVQRNTAFSRAFNNIRFNII